MEGGKIEPVGRGNGEKAVDSGRKTVKNRRMAHGAREKQISDARGQ